MNMEPDSECGSSLQRYYHLPLFRSLTEWNLAVQLFRCDSRHPAFTDQVSGPMPSRLRPRKGREGLDSRGPLIRSRIQALTVLASSSDPHFVAGLRYTQEFQAVRPVRARSFLRAAPRRTMVYACVVSFSPPCDHLECNSVSPRSQYHCLPAKTGRFLGLLSNPVPGIAVVIPGAGVCKIDGLWTAVGQVYWRSMGGLRRLRRYRIETFRKFIRPIRLSRSHLFREIA